MAMTEEHKQKMAEGRKRAAEQRRAEREAREKAEKEAARQEAELAKTAAPRHTAPSQAPPEPDRTAVEYGGQMEWGPFDRLVEVTTPYGLYGVPAWTVMHFEPYQAKLPNGDIIDSHRPVYREVDRRKLVNQG